MRYTEAAGLRISGLFSEEWKNATEQKRKSLIIFWQFLKNEHDIAKNKWEIEEKSDN